MLTVVLYCLAVLVGLILFWMYEGGSAETDKRERKCIDRKASRSPTFLSTLGLSQQDFLQFHAITDRFNSFIEVSSACEQAGLDRVNIVLGIDFTASNEWQGRKTFGGNSLHRVAGGSSTKHMNPYQRVIHIIGQALSPFIREGGHGGIRVFGFGDSETHDRAVFPVMDPNKPCRNFTDVLEAYKNAVRKVTLSGPTSFAPIINTAIELVKEWGQYAILVIIADGQVNEEQPTIDAVVEASSYPLSIIVVGVGDGPWDMMEEFDDHLPRRKFDNFQFVNFHRVTAKSKNPDLSFALHALMEIPDQYKAIKKQGYVTQHEIMTDSDEEVSYATIQRQSFSEFSL